MNLNIRDFPDEIHAKLRTIAAIDGCPIRDVVVAALRDVCTSYEKKHPDFKKLNISIKEIVN